MRVLHLTTGLSKQSAAYRLHHALLKSNIDSYVYVGIRGFSEERVIYNKSDILLKVLARLERLLLKFYPKRTNLPFNISFFNNASIKIINDLNPDIIHLHWICQFVSLKFLAKLKKPIVWTLHDSWGFTGGCHIPLSCQKFVSGCKACPHLNSESIFDLSSLIFNYKVNSLRKIKINIIGPSKWMTKQANSSSLFKNFTIRNIPNCIDTEFFSNKDKNISREKFGIPLNKKIVLFGANNALRDWNKGFDLVFESWKNLLNFVDKNSVELVIFGSKDIEFDKELNIRKIGYITDPLLFPYLYSSADVLINASRSENFSNVILESLSCGTPVVAFNIGGNSDLIISGRNGYVVDFDNFEQFHHTVLKCFEINNSILVKSTVFDYSYSNVSPKVITYYNDLMNYEVN